MEIVIGRKENGFYILLKEQEEVIKSIHNLSFDVCMTKLKEFRAELNP